jgi:hypothetical protein
MKEFGTMLETYKTFIHYGNILEVKKNDFTKYGGDFITLKLVEYEGIRMLFVMVNGEVVRTSICNN